MFKSIKKLATISVLSLGALFNVNAAVLVDGSSVTVETFLDGLASSNFTGTIQDGLDVDAFGYDLYLNEGTDSMEFYFQSEGTYCGWFCADEVVEFRFSNLTFDSPYAIYDFTGFSDASYEINSETSFSVFFTDTDTDTVTGEQFISGRFGPAMQVPATGSILLLGLALIALRAKRLVK